MLYDPPPYRGSETFRRSPLAEFDVGARSFADNTLLCRRVARAWRGRAASGGAVAHGRTVPKWGILNRGSFEDPRRHDDDNELLVYFVLRIIRVAGKHEIQQVTAAYIRVDTHFKQ